MFTSTFRTTRTLALATAFLAAAFSSTACAGKATFSLKPASPLSGPKELTVLGSRNDVVIAFEEHLRERGFRIKRFISRQLISEREDRDQIVTYADAETRYAVEIDAAVAAGGRCFGGGFKLSYLRMELIDLAANEVVMSARASGYTENCPPMSGTVFQDLVDAIVEAWEPTEVSQ